MLDQVEVRAPQQGLLLYTDKADWIRKPVAVGERIMKLPIRGTLSCESICPSVTHCY